METVVTTEGIPPSDRLSYFREAILREGEPVDVYGDRSESFSGRIALGKLGALTIAQVVSRSTARRGLHRSAEMIRRADPGLYHVVLYEEGSTVLTCDERRTEPLPGDICLLDSSRCYEDGMNQVQADICG